MSRILILYIVIALAYCEENENPVGFARLTDVVNNTKSELCAYGDGYLPFKVFNSYVGWQCYEEAYHDMKKYSLYACTEEIDTNIYQIPCLKIGSKIISFNLSSPENVDLISKTVESDTLKNTMVQCYLSVMAHCESQRFSGVARPDKGFGTWVWVPNSNTEICDIQTRSKFHIALLSISLIIGFPAVIILFYYCWTTSQIALPYHRDLLTALVFRTLFTLLIQSEVFLDMLNVSSVLRNNGASCKFLASMETIFGNLVWSCFVSEALYLYKYAKNGFSEEPDIRIYNYILTGISVAFAVIWIIVMAAAHDSNCWLGDRTWIQWINDPLRIIFIILHLVLLGDVIRMLLTKLKAVHDDTARILRRISLYTFVLIPLFLLQFSLNAGQPESTDCQDPYFYTLYFVDGIQCAVVSLFFFYFDKQVSNLVKTTLGLKKTGENEQSNFRKANMERHITTIDATQPIKPERPKEFEQARPDVNYSSVVHPEQLEKIIQLYNRMNLTQKPSVTINDGEEYSTCIPESSEGNRKISLISEYYDVESLNEFHDALVYQSSLSIFHDVNEFFDPSDKILSDENFQKKLKGNVQQLENNKVVIPVIEKNEINAMQNKIQKNDIEVQKSELVTEKSVNHETKPDRVYQSKYLVHDSDTSSSSESEDSVVEVSIRKKNNYEGRLSLRSDVSSRPKSESDLSVAIPIPEEIEPPSDGERTPEVVLGSLAFDPNKTESVENWIKNNEELYSKYLKKKGLVAPTVVVSSEATDLEAALNKREDVEEFRGSSEIIEAQRNDFTGKLDSSDDSLSDQESGTESSKIKVKDVRRDSDVYHLLSGSDSEADENKLGYDKNLRESPNLMADFEEDKNRGSNAKETETESEDENRTNSYFTPEIDSQEFFVHKTEMTGSPAELIDEKTEADMTELPSSNLPSNLNNGSFFTEESKTLAESEESSEEDVANKLECESDSEFEAENVRQMIPVKKISSSSDSSSSSFSSHSEKPPKKEAELKHQSESECSSTGVNDYYNDLTSKISTPSEIEMLNKLNEPPDLINQATDNLNSSPNNLEVFVHQSEDDLGQLPRDILEVDPKNEDLSNFMANEETIRDFQNDSYNVREKPNSLFSQEYPEIYDDLKYKSRKSRDNFSENRQNYSDMFSKHKSKILAKEKKSKSLEDIVNEDKNIQKGLPSSSSVHSQMDQQLLETEVPSKLEKSKGFANLNEELENKSTDDFNSRILFRNPGSDSSKTEEENSSSSSDESFEKSKPKVMKRSFVPRQISSNKDDDWEPQKIFY